MTNEDHESELLTSAIGGNAAALEHLLLENYSRLEQHVAPKIPVSMQKHFSTEDVLQEVFTQVFRDISRFEPQPEKSLLAWMKTISDHRLTDFLRKAKTKKRGGEFRQLTPNNAGLESTVAQLVDLLCQNSVTASRIVAHREAASAIHIGIASLPEDQRYAVRAKFLEGKDVDVIAEEMGRSPGAIRGLIHRAQKNLTEMMGRSSQWLSR